MSKPQLKLNWSAKYLDGKVVTSEEINSKDLDKKGIDSFSLYDNDDRIIYTKYISEGQVLLYRIRSIYVENIGVTERIHIVSVLEKDRAQDKFIIGDPTLIFENDRRIESGKWGFKEYAYQIELLPADCTNSYAPH